ncbi:uncharacterized protein LOC119503973 isoform X2 [Sebastes umbrosus]|nr:uncharacterized protein LOC119503973 isoform X2 [Sebastes umbrosus]XP_037651984.1 uncharacterized protein LOC119503973 isoform X2 [Sebastes umbrosus]XP_037651985.1 uncharacterized protein LOC119503973 isoform X2 [Sebastes umbrosus]XP_037651986.1 uncharacterized protein LOC119503973 isoform X2 [Sebastes umbrosus]
MYRHKTLDLENPPGATLTIGDLDDTIYSEEEDEVNGWGKFYLPEVVSMQVVGVVEGTSCPSDQLVLMTCEDRKVYAYDGQMLHLVSSSLRQQHYKGIKYPALKRYYKGEAFKHKTKEDWAEVRKKLDQQHCELVMSKKSELLENLKLLNENVESQGICMSLDCGRTGFKPRTFLQCGDIANQNSPKRGAPKQPGHNTAATVSERMASEKATEVRGRKEKKREMQKDLLHSCRYHKAVTLTALIPPPQLPPLQSRRAQAVKH